MELLFYYSFKAAIWQNMYHNKKNLHKRLQIRNTHTLENALLLCKPREKFAITRDYCMLELLRHTIKLKQMKKLQKNEITRIGIRNYIPKEIIEYTTTFIYF